jgi:H+/Cl- antiporter ClcA
MADRDLTKSVKHAVFYIFALAFHGIAIAVFAGILVEMTDKHTNWVDGCYRGNNGVFAIKKDDGTTGWYNYFTGNTVAEPTECNSEATAELYIVLISLVFVVLDTLLTVVYWAMNFGNIDWSEGKAFMTWDKETGAMGMFRKGVRASSIFGAYLAAFVWACGFTAAFNSRPSTNGDFRHEINPAFEASSFLVSFMISILVTILPVQEDSGYSMLWK